MSARLVMLLALVAARSCPAADAPDFTSAVRPILANHCFKCHGPDEQARKARFRLDVRDSAIGEAKSGAHPIVPGHPETSELIKRIDATDPDDVMPPPAARKSLTPAERDTLRAWIAGGAEYREHWAFLPPRRAEPPAVPAGLGPEWSRNPIDRFVAARLAAAGLRPSPPAERAVIARRVWFDLVGLPPTPEEAAVFVDDPDPAAYERMVDRLLAMPQYGERWARRWLDLARYADTNGYEKDRPRIIWPFRDWVISAFNDDLPFDRFTIAQVAGDLLPGATQADVVATGFHRNTMLDEEGGVDPLEYRFYNLVDRVATTGRAWLGLTLGCAQCHAHKFDPLSQREYYQVMACLDNVEEPELRVHPDGYQARLATAEAAAAAATSALPERFPLPAAWSAPQAAEIACDSGEQAQRRDDGSWRFAGAGAERDTYHATLTLADAADRLRLELVPDPAAPHGGPGRATDGNCFLTGLTVSVLGADGAPPRTVTVAQASADYAQSGSAVAGAIDADPKTGWGVLAPDGRMDVAHHADFILAEAVPAGSRLAIVLDQQHGGHATIAGLRLLVAGRPGPDTVAEHRRQARLAYERWLGQEAAANPHWTVLHPRSARSEVPILTILADGSVLASGDQTKSDTYHLVLPAPPAGTTALRLEVMPDPSLPRGGPGRQYYEFPAGDFGLTELRASADGADLAFARAVHSFAAKGSGADKAIDGKKDTFWAIDGGQGRYHTAVFTLAAPLTTAGELRLDLLCERYASCGIGRCRVSATSDPPPAQASALDPALVDLLLRPAAQRSGDDDARLFAAFLQAAPELAEPRAEIAKALAAVDAGPLTLVMRERPAGQERATFVHHRGEWLQPAERVQPATPAILPRLPAGDEPARLRFARWLVARDNPLTARVAVNRQWAAFFGRGLVRTVDDFGYQGDPPLDQGLLDWLAVRFMDDGWSMKKLHRLIVTSAAYRQSSRVDPALLARDADNALLARGPRLRLEAEAIRDGVLRAAGLLSSKLGGPSVFPAQPPGITTEGAFGALNWQTSTGEDRYRRGLYTFAKRQAPYAFTATFDAPSGEVCVAQRDVSDSPLQALTMLNDTVVVEAAQALGRLVAAAPGDDAARLELLYRRCLTRAPSERERAKALAFLAQQRQRLAAHEIDAAALAGPGAGDPVACAAWAALARVVFNLDEMITKG
jgi:hypothetical protein